MHVAIIMDGNGRWATRRNLPRTAGHVEGAKAVRVTVEAAARCARQLPEVTAQDFRRLLNEVDHSAQPAPDVDLLIRTGGASAE